jgi:hypothetical protein
MFITAAILVASCFQCTVGAHLFRNHLRHTSLDVPTNWNGTVNGTAPSTNVTASKLPAYRLRGFTYGGKGCPQGSVRLVTNANGTETHLVFDSFVARIGPTVDVSANRVDCQMNFDLAYEKNWQYSIFSMDYKGYAELDKGVTGQIKSNYYFSYSSSQVRENKRSPLLGDLINTLLFRARNHSLNMGNPSDI